MFSKKSNLAPEVLAVVLAPTSGPMEGTTMKPLFDGIIRLTVAVAATLAIALATSAAHAEISTRDSQALSKSELIYIATVRKDGNQSKAAPRRSGSPSTPATTRSSFRPGAMRGKPNASGAAARCLYGSAPPTVPPSSARPRLPRTPWCRRKSSAISVRNIGRTGFSELGRHAPNSTTATASRS